MSKRVAAPRSLLLHTPADAADALVLCSVAALPPAPPPAAGYWARLDRIDHCLDMIDHASIGLTRDAARTSSSAA